MAIGMKQNEVVEPVGAAVNAPDDVVGMPLRLDAYRLTAVRTSASLSSPEPPSTTVQGLAHSALFALFEVELPLRVVRIGFGSDLDVAPDWYRADINQLDPLASTLHLHLGGERPPLKRGYPIPLGQPLLALVRMASPRPSPQTNPNSEVHAIKGVRRDRRAMIICPSFYLTIQDCNQVRLRGRPVCPDQCADVVEDGPHALLRRLYQ